MIERSVRIGVSRNQHHHKGTLKPHLWIEAPDETPIQSTPHWQHRVAETGFKLSSATCTVKIKNQKRGGMGQGPAILYGRRRKKVYKNTNNQEQEQD